MVVTAVNNIIYGGPIENSLTKDAKSLGEFLLKRFEQYDEEIVLVDAFNGIEVTANQLKTNFIHFARSLRAHGIGEGDVVGICSESRMEFAYAVFGTIMVNATMAPYSATLTENELNHVINISKPKIIFTSRMTAKKISLIAEKNSFIRKVVNFDNDENIKNILPYQEFLIKQHEQSKEHFQVSPVNLNENISVILCSSGTTGLPKGVQLTQRNILHTTEGRKIQEIFKEGCILLSVVPWVHIFGYLALLQFPSLGAKLVFLPKFNRHRFLDCIQRYRVQLGIMVPPLMVFLAKDPIVDNYDLSSLKMLLCSTAPLSKELCDAVQKRTSVPMILQGYGLTESAVGVLMQSMHHRKYGSVGTVRVDTYAKVIDPDTGKALGPNQRGELCFKSASVMKGYIGDEKATNEAIDNDGWLHTGDIGYYDEEFNFFIVDRIKELIKYKGHQVAPAELEALLLTNSRIQDAAVVGKLDEMCGELPSAFVVKRDPHLSEQDVIDFVADRASDIKRLRGGVRFLNEIPKTPTGKILRRELRELINNRTKSKL